MFSHFLRHRTKIFIQFHQKFKIFKTIEPFTPVITRKMAKTVTLEFANFEAKLSPTNALEDYNKWMDEKMRADVIMPHEVYNECWRKISAAARETIWKMLFPEDNKVPSKEQLDKASELLKLHKEDACFYQAGEYNKWIVTVRDEVLKRKMLDFWKNEMVAKELGPCWARDSDLFDDPEDPEPAKFYKYADCEAAWLKKKQNDNAQNAADLVASALLTTETNKTSSKSLKKISLETPLNDYNDNVEALDQLNSDENDGYLKLLTEAREVIWQLLFGESSLSTENSKKAAELLEQCKRDACFYCPWDYNDWIPGVRDELLKRKYFDFWQDVVVKNELGLCWARDSDYFDNMDDPAPMEFYKVGEEFIKQHKK